jgi:hypothetical protein
MSVKKWKDDLYDMTLDKRHHQPREAHPQKRSEQGHERRGIGAEFRRGDYASRCSIAGSGGTVLGWHGVNINEVFAGIDMGNMRGPCTDELQCAKQVGTLCEEQAQCVYRYGALGQVGWNIVRINVVRGFCGESQAWRVALNSAIFHLHLP